MQNERQSVVQTITTQIEEDLLEKIKVPVVARVVAITIGNFAKVEIDSVQNEKCESSNH